VLESNKDPYKNAVRLYKMYRMANKFSHRVLDTPKLDAKPQDLTQRRSVSTSVDNAALSTVQSRLAKSRLAKLWFSSRTFNVSSTTKTSRSYP